MTTEVINTPNRAGATVTYGYDIRGELTSIGYPGKGNVTRAYGDDGEMTGVSDFGGRNFAFAYDQDMNPTNTGYPNGVSSANAYDNAGRLTSITDSKGSATLASFTYGRSVGGDVTGETAGGTSAGSNKTYTYNTLGQLASENGGSFTYDAADNLTKIADGTTMTYDVANQVQTRTPSSGPATTYAYDVKGNRTGSVTNNVTTNASYDQANRMTAYGSSATYNYDGGGLRTSKTVTGTTANFTYDTADGLPLIIDDGTNAYVYGPGGIVLEQINGSTPTYLHQDQLGSTRLLTDVSGTVVGTYKFDAYGSGTHTGAATTPLQYAGQYLDSESGLYWMRARYYDSGTGQFTSRDPLVSITGDAYAYVNGDPTNSTDETGLWCLLGSHADGGCRGTGKDFVNNHPVAALRILDTSAGVLDGLTLGHANAVLPQSAQNSWSYSGWFVGGTVAGSYLLGDLGARTALAGCSQYMSLSSQGLAGETGAASSDGFALSSWARKVKLNSGSDVTAQLFEHRGSTVAEYIGKFRDGKVNDEVPTDVLGQTVHDALRSGNRKVRKLLVNGRWER